ncbi:DHH family phosphoesterase [Vibrio ulleungensis]|uniref:DHH family phosphoesterase n=1 Tax=Vibrio ulleungensis TaxID=2807619 RepID=A0ABS2HPC8_9VIBR|nr:DHH family phosphoesterase [Vibrio ulleungensis]MBM7037726.1 DHH family phosphoesterase [Vibrio ulleungensis]
MHVDVFNGDADGICALLQLRLATAKKATLITGIKRDIQLLQQVTELEDVSSVTVLDISMEKNLTALHSLLDSDVPVFYCDHHRHGEIPSNGRLTALIDVEPNTCTSLLVNTHLHGAFAKWAVVGAFGDNMFARAYDLANELKLPQSDTEFLKELGTLLNYNGYGASIEDLHFPPSELYQLLLNYDCPLKLRDDPASAFYVLRKGFGEDTKNTQELTPIVTSEAATVFELPCEAWARRISGVFGNDLANQSPGTAHAVMTLNQSGEDYTVSVRAPINNRVGADEVCSAFATGGGRKAAAGINQLPIAKKNEFIEALTRFYQ